jgi:hypothetical protein
MSDLGRLTDGLAEITKGVGELLQFGAVAVDAELALVEAAVLSVEVHWRCRSIPWTWIRMRTHFHYTHPITGDVYKCHKKWSKRHQRPFEAFIKTPSKT